MQFIFERLKTYSKSKNNNVLFHAVRSQGSEMICQESFRRANMKKKNEEIHHN